MNNLYSELYAYILLIICMLFLPSFIQNANSQGPQIQHVDYLVENNTGIDFSGVLWIEAEELYELVPGFDGFSFIITTTHSPDLELDMKKKKTDELESQALDENRDGRVEKIGVFLPLKSFEKKVITIHIGEVNRISRIKGQYKNLCNVIIAEDEIFWESDKIAYRYDHSIPCISIIGKRTQRNILEEFTSSYYNGKKQTFLGEEISICQKSPGFGGLGIIKNGVFTGFDKYVNTGACGDGPLASGFSVLATTGKSIKVEIHYTISRESRWTIVEIVLSGNWKGVQFATGIPLRTGEHILSSSDYIASFAGQPVLGLGLYVPENFNGGMEKMKGYHLVKLMPDNEGKLIYAFSGYWELEHNQNVVYPEEVDILVPEVVYSNSDKRLNRVVIRPSLKLNNIENFKSALNGDITVQLRNKPVIRRISREALTYTELYPPEAVKKNRKKTYKEARDLMINRIAMLAEKGLNDPGNEKFWEQSDSEGNPHYLKPNTGWGNGYWVSMLWDSYRITGDSKFKEWALKSNSLMIGNENRPSMVAGLDYWDASVRTFKETGDKTWRESALKVADNMYDATMNSSAGLMPTSILRDRKDLDNPYKDIIYVKVDAMICIPILFWAYQETGNIKYLEAGKLHAMKTKEYLIDPDGSAFQLSWHHPETGELIGVGTNQGLGGNSRWARGQAWVLDGFADAYNMSKDQEFADIFRQSVEWISENLPEDYVPWYDYDDQGVFYRYRDTSAPAISAYALLRMSEAEEDPEQARNYKELGIKIVNSLIDNYLTKVGEEDTRPSGMLSHQCYVKHFNSSGEQIWGSFNLLRALVWLHDNGIERVE